jgi:hypothetical protein
MSAPGCESEGRPFIESTHMALPSSTRISIGVALAWVGVPLGMYFNFLLPIIPWSPVFMLLSVLLIGRFNRLTSLRMKSATGFLTAVLGFQLMMLAYGLFSAELTAQYLSFHLYIIALVIALMFCSRDDLSSDDVILWTFLLSFICTALGAAFLSQGLIIGEEAWQLRRENEAYALEIFTASSGALINFASVLYFPRKRHRLLQWLTYVAAVLDCYIVLFGEKRTPLLVLLAIAFIFLRKQRRLRAPYLVFGGVATLGMLSLAYASNDIFSARIDGAVHDTLYGIGNLFGNTGMTDTTGSAIERYESRQWAFHYIEHQFTPLDYVFGGGYMVRWLDAPLLQSYLDMGILGFFGYLCLVVVYPVRFVFKRLASNLQLLALSLCLYNVLSCINSGNPYIYGKFVPVVLLAFFVSPSRRLPSRPQPSSVSLHCTH